MTTLVKPLLYEITAQGTAGTPGTPYIPAQPPRVVEELVKVVRFYPVTHDPSLTPGDPGGAYITYEVVYTTIPGSAAIPATPGTPPTPAVVATLYDRQWNSAADSIAEVPAGSYIEFKVRPSSYAVFVGLDADTVNSTLPSAYRYGLMVDASGIRIFENGVSGALLGANSPTTTLRIVRSETGQVFYHVVGNSLMASPQAPVAPSVTTHGYGLLYSSLDAVTDAKIAELNLIEATVAFRATTGFTVKADPRVVFGTTTEFKVATDTAVIFPATTQFLVEPSPVIVADVTFPVTTTFEVSADSGGRGTWTLAPMQWMGADYAAPGMGAWRLPRFTATGNEQVYVPAAPDEGFWILPRVAAWGFGLDEDHGSGSITLQAVTALGAEEGVTYAQGVWELPVHFSMRSVPPWWPDNTLMLVSEMRSTASFQMQLELVLILNSVGELTSTLTLSRLQLLSLLSTLSASSSISLTGSYRLSLLSSLNASSLQSLQTLLGGAELPDDAAVWVVNLDTNASAQYENYGFNSFFQRGTDYFGVANDGIYKLSGDTDAGVPIDAIAAFVRSSLGQQGVKRIPTAYLGTASDGALVLRVDVDGIVRHYKARTFSSSLQQHRVDLGRGARGTYWEFELMNQNGEDFKLADMTLLPVALDRRI